MNIYGFWQYKGEDPIENNVILEKGDLVRIFSKSKDKIIGSCKGSIKEFDYQLFVRFCKKRKFVRPVREHKPSTCKTSLAGGKCERCDIFRKKRNHG
jgi:hypothetical protein